MDGIVSTCKKKPEYRFSSLDFLKEINIAVLSSFSPEELDKFGIALQDFGKKVGEKLLSSLTEKISNLNIAILFYPSDWFKLIEGMNETIKPLVEVIRKAHLEHKLGIKTIK